MSELTSLDLIVIAACSWLAIGLVGVSQPHNFRLISRVLFPLGALISLAVAGIALASLAAAPQVRILPLGLPDLPFHLRLDALSAFFLLLLGATAAGISIYAAGYLRPSEGMASYRSTARPASVSASAAISPAGPPPTTMAWRDAGEGGAEVEGMTGG